MSNPKVPLSEQMIQWIRDNARALNNIARGDVTFRVHDFSFRRANLSMDFEAKADTVPTVVTEIPAPPADKDLHTKR